MDTMDERVTKETNDDDAAHENAFAIEAFIKAEHWLTIGLGMILVAATLLVLTSTVVEVWESLRRWPNTDSVFTVVDKLLFVLMLVEILHTVRTAISTHTLAIEPFLIVGLIACVRRILVVTLQSSGLSSEGGPKTPFDHAMIELGVLGGLTLVLILSIYMSRRSRLSRPND